MDKLPKLTEFYEAPLYKLFEFQFEKYSKDMGISIPQSKEEVSIIKRNVEREKFFKNLVNPKIRLELKCPYCSNNRVFKLVYGEFHQEDWRKSNAGFGINKEGIIVNEFECSKDVTHRIFYIFRITPKGILKIGQHPSVADFQDNFDRKYEKIIGNEKYLELKKAIGLSSHGIGIGSFVYLRRVFEYLIEESHLRAKSSKDWNEEEYQRNKVKDKIKNLKDFLPEFIYQNSDIYGILSKGIHQLSDEECLNSFSLMKLSIEIILDEEIERKSKEKKIEEVNKSLSKLKEKLSKK